MLLLGMFWSIDMSLLQQCSQIEKYDIDVEVETNVEIDLDSVINLSLTLTRLSAVV